MSPALCLQSYGLGHGVFGPRIEWGRIAFGPNHWSLLWLKRVRLRGGLDHSKFSFFVVVVFFYFFVLFIFKLYNIVLVLPNIEMNPPQVYLCYPS